MYGQNILKSSKSPRNRALPTTGADDWNVFLRRFKIECVWVLCKI